MGSKQTQSRELVRTLGRYLPARHFKGERIPGRWMRGGTDKRCCECDAKIGEPCTYRLGPKTTHGRHVVTGFVHARRESSETRIRAVH